MTAITNTHNLEKASGRGQGQMDMMWEKYQQLLLALRIEGTQARRCCQTLESGRSWKSSYSLMLSERNLLVRQLDFNPAESFFILPTSRMMTQNQKHMSL